MKVRLAGPALLVAVVLSVTACSSSSGSGSALATTSAAPLSSAAAAVSSAKSAASGAMSSAAGAVSSAAAGAASSARSAISSAVASATAGSASAAGAFDICTILPFAEAAQLSGQPYTQGEPSTTPDVSACAYDNDDATATGVNVEVLSDPTGDTWSVVHVEGVTDISGLGDKAMWDNDNTLYAMKGAYLLQVNGLDNDQAHSEALAKPVLAALP